MPRLNEGWKSIPCVMSVSPVLTGRIERRTGTHHVLPCTEAQRGAPKRCRDPELMETLHMPRVPPQRPPPLTHTPAGIAHILGLGGIQKQWK